MKLGAKTDEASGVHGEYRFAGSPTVIVVAGDRDGDTLEIEESTDGTHITGNWVGKFAADRLELERHRVGIVGVHPLTGYAAVGDKQIEMKLGAKTDEASGVHGEYRFAGSPTVIVVAGDRDGDT
ncbi:hypothetical protein ACRXB1_37420, partial [Caballeronia sp. M23-90]